MKSGWLLVLVGALASCAPGYMKASELEDREQGPAACAKSCEQIGMRMTALVLVGDQQPGCVCQPLVKEAPSPRAPAPGLATPQEGAAASTTGYVVIAAAEVARRQAEQQQQQQQQQWKSK